MTEKMRIWFWTQTEDGNKTIFYRDVGGPNQAYEWLNLLVDYNLLLGDTIVANASGLEVFENNEWQEWDNDGDDIWQYFENLKEVDNE